MHKTKNLEQEIVEDVLTTRLTNYPSLCRTSAKQHYILTKSKKCVPGPEASVWKRSISILINVFFSRFPAKCEQYIAEKNGDKAVKTEKYANRRNSPCIYPQSDIFFANCGKVYNCGTN